MQFLFPTFTMRLLMSMSQNAAI